ncbi:hypothetical protein PGTUg99_033734 [Puccinia graminis f. sp. tritici]|uniref:Uncharacterized protein n=1 Tax=Puccinia graminis f. sp. tritici TaxID=56615 RepID=A0A5B0NJZ1_PUCGR|nr:hypothetical protein PGTUg99_033734 [Puccinia graminis f. sp. tritici]
MPTLPEPLAPHNTYVWGNLKQGLDNWLHTPHDAEELISWHIVVNRSSIIVLAVVLEGHMRVETSSSNDVSKQQFHRVYKFPPFQGKPHVYLSYSFD